MSEPAPAPEVQIAIDATGGVTLEGLAVTPEELTAALEAAARANPEIRALIAADRAVPYGLLVDVIDRVRAAGVAHFALNVAGPSSE